MPGPPRPDTTSIPRRSNVPAGTSAAPDRLRVDNALIKAIARAFRWRKLLETGVHGTIEEIATREKINASDVGRLLRGAGGCRGSPGGAAARGDDAGGANEAVASGSYEREGALESRVAMAEYSAFDKSALQPLSVPSLHPLAQSSWVWWPSEGAGRIASSAWPLGQSWLNRWRGSRRRWR